jgi:hypothetical protein
MESRIPSRHVQFRHIARRSPPRRGETRSSIADEMPMHGAKLISSSPHPHRRSCIAASWSIAKGARGWNENESAISSSPNQKSKTSPGEAQWRRINNPRSSISPSPSPHPKFITSSSSHALPPHITRRSKNPLNAPMSDIWDCYQRTVPRESFCETAGTDPRYGSLSVQSFMVDALKSSIWQTILMRCREPTSSLSQ